jgi:hypothetical protein
MVLISLRELKSSSILDTAIKFKISLLAPAYPPDIDILSKDDGGNISFGIFKYEKMDKTNIKNSNIWFRIDFSIPNLIKELIIN